VRIAVDALLAAGQKHHFLSVHKSGQVAIVETRGNDDCHIILRGGKTPNYDSSSVAAACEELAKAKLRERLKEALGSADDERIRTEIAVFAGKSDVDEELERLTVHLAEVDRVLRHGGAAGKRLDFLAQELNREANTLASKAAGQQISDGALELKLLVEQIREQVQNIE
jgi:uncharacterized protein (TIGR00255 family)